jgi:hypothetical protein
VYLKIRLRIIDSIIKEIIRQEIPNDHSTRNPHSMQFMIPQIKAEKGQITKIFRVNKKRTENIRFTQNRVSIVLNEVQSG